MKAEELRIKNFISDGIFIFLVSEISKDGTIKGISICMDGVDALEINDRWRLNEQYSLNIKNIQPIPLNEDWLKKFGFKAGGVYDNYKLNGIELDSMYRTCDTDERSMFYLSGEIPTSMKISITSVHQLQNLYFALTGQELTIKSDNQ